MALPSAMFRIIISIVLFVNLAGAIVALGGLAKITDMCRKNDPQSGTGGLIAGDRVYSCGMYYSLDWWIVCLQIFVSILALLASWVNSFNSRFFILFALAVATTLYCGFAQTYVTSSYALRDTDNVFAKSIKACAAGAIAVLITNFIFALFFAPENNEANVILTQAPKTEA
eukprot:CAMPEP_0119103324 /NCGR_PEP_ID=MMETSP1180-20130426/1772_1 /TAXON_ID=3052 ORGANISM="Chlamydomonas cf sp, Strain CCMP681" /NCGR_SAMPLE_ID=MMETSP1180 /ASSEMBLY_ACC=CAM_ASM_000741 /LENGTH=170 /DNA_ID=CAMNT_0007087789 /DNA_START=160 /DNA_END=672 /DNA_ORIENTATION=+